MTHTMEVSITLNISDAMMVKAALEMRKQYIEKELLILFANNQALTDYYLNDIKVLEYVISTFSYMKDTKNSITQ